jgi:hypothetical protein
MTTLSSALNVSDVVLHDEDTVCCCEEELSSAVELLELSRGRVLSEGTHTADAGEMAPIKKFQVESCIAELGPTWSATSNLIEDRSHKLFSIWCKNINGTTIDVSVLCILLIVPFIYII